MSREEPTTHDTPTPQPAIDALGADAGQPETLFEEALEEETPGEETLGRRREWLHEPEPLELARRPRRRALTPVPLALLGVLLSACGFIGGVFVEKGQSSSGSAGATTNPGSRFAALRGGAAGAGAPLGASSGASALGRATGTSRGFRRPTVGQVSFIDANTLYVSTAEGNTVKVTTSPATSVSKTVSSALKDIHPGETVTVAGTVGSNGVIDAESIGVGSGGGGLAALFGAGAGAGGGERGGGSGGSSEGPALFGK
jgi:Domain of unknown function (DUF5666)